MSGIATHTAALRQPIEAVDSPTLLLDTRKTAAGMRVLDKMAVRAGRAVNHRIGLYDKVMIKDNHITAAAAYRRPSTRSGSGAHSSSAPCPSKSTRTVGEVRQLLAYLHTENRTTAPPVTRIMLDNVVSVKRNETTNEVTLSISGN